MDHVNDKIDERFSRKAQFDRASVSDHLWLRLENRLDKRVRVRRWGYWGGIAAGIVLILTFTFLFNIPTNSPATVTDLSEQSEDGYFVDYRDFVRSERYAKLVDQYNAVQ